jgi:hypothetical protein
MKFTQSGFALNATLDVNIVVDNPNYVDISSRNITLDAIYLCSSCTTKNTGVNVGKVTINEPLRFQPRKKTTYNHIKVSFTSIPIAITDVGNFFTDCSPKTRKVKMQLQGTVTLFILYQVDVPIEVPVTKQVDVPCCQGSGC